MSLVEKLIAPAPGRLDTYSDTWKFVSAWAEKALQDVRESNDSTKKSEAQTMVLRGQIKMLKELLALPNPPRERARPPPDEF